MTAPNPVDRACLGFAAVAVVVAGLVVTVHEAHRATTDPEPWPATAVTR